ncbi:tRNA threonylcarbamoyladenosine biosynthesis protein TsaB [Methylobrevis pamukkalensis]|uniref:tRNA threonylcarbamoyladenosine biosynthesis protein TsaB n=1 Tax=Methylobrevis pamukkalensis TaxID=1439726 RepID=A0A1E3H741_9HYPH|nr:tRNA threonylcarbamoyladenosine biosynthesis protein TsaB [Methylobrevis pamukkalensis]
MLRSEPLARGHGERLFAMIAEVLDEAGVTLADVDRFAVTTGPGSFTGIRIGLAAARGFGLALKRPVVGIGTLAALARSFEDRPSGPVVSVVDARKGEVYMAVHAAGGMEMVAPFVATAEVALAHVPPDTALLIGSGAPLLVHAATCAGQRVPPHLARSGPDVLALARLGLAAPAPARPPAPVYVRPPDAKPSRRPSLLAALEFDR